MKTIHLSFPHQRKTSEIPDTSAAIGFFDGVHLGHQEVIQEAIDHAIKQDTASAVITFYPHPSVVLRKDKGHSGYITPLPEKQKFLEEMGVDLLYVIEFNKELSLLTPEEFVTHFLVKLNIKHLVAGFDFTFGHKGKGNMDQFNQYAGDALTYSVVSKIEKQKEKISSTSIRNAIDSGEIGKANELLGRPLSLTGKVISGDKRGRTIGYPTANLDFSKEYHLPKLGVYAVKVTIDGQKKNGMANLGFKPTFNEKEEQASVEVHIFDFSEDIYGKEIKLEWHAYIREEKKFSGVDELIRNLEKDEKKIRLIL